MAKREKGITRPGYEANSAETAYTVLGFNLISTGGNCTAFHKPISGGRHILITAYGDDPVAPTEAAEPVYVALYKDGESEPIDSFHSPDSDAVATKLSWKGWA